MPFWCRSSSCIRPRSVAPGRRGCGTAPGRNGNRPRMSAAFPYSCAVRRSSGYHFGEARPTTPGALLHQRGNRVFGPRLRDHAEAAHKCHTSDSTWVHPASERSAPLERRATCLDKPNQLSSSLMAFGPMDPVTARSSHVYWLMVSRSYRPKTILTLSPMTRPRYGRRSPAPPALSSSLDIRMAALSSRQPATTSAWRHSSTYARSPRRRETQRLSTRTNIPRRLSSNTLKLWRGGFGCARQVSQNLQETCRRRSSNSSGPLRWRLWLISLLKPSWALHGSINQRLTLLVPMTGPFNLNCSASWLRV